MDVCNTQLWVLSVWLNRFGMEGRYRSCVLVLLREDCCVVKRRRDES